LPHKENENGLVKVGSKEEARDLGFDSTNKADCLMMYVRTFGRAAHEERQL